MSFALPGLLEIFATLFTVACVGLAVKRSTWQYPIGIAGTILFFFVFWQATLFASAWLQIFFTLVQIYGWWYWTRGDNGQKPKITRVSPKFFVGSIGLGLIAAIAMSYVLGHLGASMALMDSGIFMLSVVAQFFLDRKKLENWIVWAGVNIASIYVYASMGLGLTTILYIGLLLNTGLGYYAWYKELKSYKEI